MILGIVKIGGLMGLGPAPAFPITNFDASVADENHIELYWNTPWVSASAVSIPAVWLDDVNTNYRMTNEAAFTCSGITSGADITLTCNITR